MTPEQKSFFAEHGYLLLNGSVSKAQVKPIAKYIADELDRLQVRSSGLKELPPFQQIGKLSTMIKRDDLGERLINAELRMLINTLGGPRLSTGPGQLLISLPEQGTWTTRGLNWHVDISSPDPSRPAGIQAFILLDDVEPQGGGTLVLAGSHKRSGSKEIGQRIRYILRENGDLNALLRDFGLSVVEMSGKAGDVYLMDMRLLHTPAINARKKLRMMATIRFYPS
ncbi:MAG: phytanoyl-CoA dioxygenase family protein [Flavobacteriales bacterium]|nr:phytanoyl-CoA dioxygenase family protein [Flavobacteriales bacterium]